MTTPNFETAIQQAEEKLAEAKRYMAEHKSLYERWANEVAIAGRVLDGLRMAAGLPYGAARKDEPRQPMIPTLRLPAEPVAPTPEAQPEKAPSTFQGSGAHAVVNHFDRAAAKRACRTWRIRYPVTKSNQTYASFVKQAVIRTVVDSDGYDDWLAQGGVSLTTNSHNATIEQYEAAAKFCGINANAVRREARRVLDDIMTYGVRGEDFV